MNIGDVLFQVFSLIWVIVIIGGIIYAFKFLRQKRVDSNKIVKNFCQAEFI